MTPALPVLQTSVLVLAFAAVFLASRELAANPSSWPRRAFAAYAARLDQALDALFEPRRGRLIALAQLASAPPLVAFALTAGSWRPLLALLLLAVLPGALLQRALVRQRQAIEKSLPSVALTLANSLRAAPNIVAALTQTQALSPAHVGRELGLVLKEVRLGSSLELALTRSCSRVRSADLDALTSGILIGRQVGGNLSEILETLSATLREMARLAGVLRSKTADSRSQFLLIALAPGVLIALLGSFRSDHFTPLRESPIGWVVVLTAALLWLTSVLIARKVLAVEL